MDAAIRCVKYRSCEQWDRKPNGNAVLYVSFHRYNCLLADVKLVTRTQASTRDCEVVMKLSVKSNQ